MKNKLLLSSLFSLSILTFSGTAKAQESADATFTGTLSASTEVVKIQDGAATINPESGFLDGLVSPIFSVTTSQPTGTDGRFTSAEFVGIPTLASVEGLIYVALINGTPEVESVVDALSPAPEPGLNPDVIVYQIKVTPDGEPSFDFNDGALEGTIISSPGTSNVSANLANNARTGTFGPEDSAGEYTANFTLTAVSSL